MCVWGRFGSCVTESRCETCASWYVLVAAVSCHPDRARVSGPSRLITFVTRVHSTAPLRAPRYTGYVRCRSTLARSPTLRAPSPPAARQQSELHQSASGSRLSGRSGAERLGRNGRVPCLCRARAARSYKSRGGARTVHSPAAPPPRDPTPS